MKKAIQIILILILIISSLIFYKLYFADNKKKTAETNPVSVDDQKFKKNNLIKNLKYEVKLNQNKQYVITADFSEISYEGAGELVNMQKVQALFIDNDNLPLLITSDTAIYNNSNHNTNFRKNVQIKYIDNMIVADKVDLNFQNNEINVFENVKYNGQQIQMMTDNIKINLITKKIDIYMNDKNKNVMLNTK